LKKLETLKKTRDKKTNTYSYLQYKQRKITYQKRPKEASENQYKRKKKPTETQYKPKNENLVQYFDFKWTSRNYKCIEFQKLLHDQSLQQMPIVSRQKLSW